MGFDYVKVDWCGGATEKLPGAIQYAQIARAIQKAEKITGRKLSLSICEWGSHNPWFWAPGVGEIKSTLWRTGGDIIPPVVESLHDAEHDKRIITSGNLPRFIRLGLASRSAAYRLLQRFRHDGDGMRGMTAALDRSHMGQWVISSAPLMVGSDLTRLSPATLSLLTNKEALATRNDTHELQPIKVDEPAPGIQIWAKPMEIAGRRAVAILNRTDASTQVKLNWEKLGAEGPSEIIPRHLEQTRLRLY